METLIKFFKNLYGMFSKIFSTFSSKAALKVSKGKFVEKILRKFQRYFGKILEEFPKTFEIFSTFYENVKIFEEIFGRFVGNRRRKCFLHSF